MRGVDVTMLFINDNDGISPNLKDELPLSLRTRHIMHIILY